ncbi:MAG: hypothetical protein JXX14_06800 [Deltaproteobacteria bacterium]|nr:hypothetical protein [Deltaproteobacteria bacterium]
MRFRCPRCQTGYELPLESLPIAAGEKTPYRLKCVRCKCIFIMTVEMASPEDAMPAQKDVYYELISPDSVPDAESGAESGAVTRSDATQRLRFEFRSVEGDEIDGPTVSKAEAWEKDNTLVLSEYAIGSFRRAATRKAVIAGSISFLAIGFVLYVAGMNGWSLSINRLDQDIKRAFSLQTDAEITADLVQQLSITLGKGYTLKVRQGRTVGVIRGEIQNNSRFDVTQVMLEGRILDASRNVVSTVVVPCNVKLPDKRLRKVRAQRIPRLYLRGGKPAVCNIRSGYSTPFNVIFHQLPAYFNSTHSFEVHARAAAAVR